MVEGEEGNESRSRGKARREEGIRRKENIARLEMSRERSEVKEQIGLKGLVK